MNIMPTLRVLLYLGSVAVFGLFCHILLGGSNQKLQGLNNILKEIRSISTGRIDDSDIDLYKIPTSLEKLSTSQLFGVYSRVTSSFHILCRNHLRLGGTDGTGKEICADRKMKPQRPCLIYSFGSNNQFQFEEDAVYFLKCEVHTFDHTMGRFKKTLTPQNVTLHHMGLDGKTDPEKKMWALDDIIKKLGHEGRTIDILKLDIEEFEFPALDQMISSGTLKYVKQLLVEFHLQLKGEKLTNEIMIKRLRVFSHLYNYGFYTFSREKFNYIYVKELHYKVNLFAETSFINNRYL